MEKNRLIGSIIGHMKKCPKCGKELVRIVYGMPTAETFEAAERKEVFIGGCEVGDNMPVYHCYNCILDFDKDLKEPTKSENFDE